MTREDYRKHKELIEQWADGAHIEFQSISGEWIETDAPWWSDVLEYRVKEEDLLLVQLDLIEEVNQKAKINIVTCGSCGTVILSRDGAEGCKCHRCGFVGEMCDFPDYLY